MPPSDRGAGERSHNMNNNRLAALGLLLICHATQGAIVGSSSFGTNCWATSPAPSVPFAESATDTASFSSDLRCLALHVPYSSGYSQVDAEQQSTVTEGGITSTGLVLHTKSGLWSGLGTSQMTVTLSPTSDYQYEFLVATGEATTDLEPGFITTKASFLIQLSDTGTSTDLLKVTAAGIVGSLSGLLLAGHSYEFRALADVLESPLYNRAAYEVNLALTPVPGPATAPLLLTALAVAALRRKKRTPNG